jgi:hypothetical protein
LIPPLAERLRKIRLMTLVHLWLIHGHKADSVHHVNRRKPIARRVIRQEG